MTCEPEILEKLIAPEDEFLVLASDGLWDVMRNEGLSSDVYTPIHTSLTYTSTSLTHMQPS